MPISVVQQGDSGIHVLNILCKIFFSIIAYPGDWIQFPVLYIRTLLFIHSKCNILHIPTPNSQSIPIPSPLPLGKHKSVLYVCVSISVICAIFQIPHIIDILQYLSFFDFFQISISIIFSRSIHVAVNGRISFFFMAE